MYSLTLVATAILLSLAGIGATASRAEEPHASPLAVSRSGSASGSDAAREQFGLRGDGHADDTAALRAALIAAGAAPQGELRLPTGTYRFTGQLVIPLGVSVFGSGPSFGTVLLADGPNAQVRLVGRESGSRGWVFRQRIVDLTIRPRPNSRSASALIEIESGYNIQLRDVLISDVPAGMTAVALRDCGAVVLQNVVIRGRDDLSSQRSGKGIVVSGTSSVALYSPDIEALSRGIEVHDASQVDIFSPYMERNIVGVENSTSTQGRLQMFGGRIFAPNDACFGVRVSSGESKTGIWGTYIYNQNGTNRVYAVPGATLAFLDGASGRLAVGSSRVPGAVSTATTAFQVNSDQMPGFRFGLSIGSFSEYISDDAATLGDWAFVWPGPGNRAARFIGEGPSSLDLVTDGSLTAAHRVSGGRLQIPFGRHILLDASLANVFEVRPADSEPFAVDNPINPAAGQLITVRLVNTYGSLGSIAWGSAFRLASWAHPAVGYSRSITFVFDGACWIEVSRTPADVPN